MTQVSHAESISLLFTPRGINVSPIFWCAFKPTQPLTKKKKKRKKQQSLHLWLPLAIHFYICVTFSDVPSQPSLYGCVVNHGGNWPRDTSAGLFFSQVRFPISLTAWPHRCLCQHSKRYSLLSFLTSPSPQKSYLKGLPNYSLRWNGKELGFSLCSPNPGGCIITIERLIRIEKHTWVSVNWKWTLNIEVLP